MSRDRVRTRFAFGDRMGLYVNRPHGQLVWTLNGQLVLALNVPKLKTLRDEYFIILILMQPLTVRLVPSSAAALEAARKLAAEHAAAA